MKKKIASILIGRKGSVGFKNKNVLKLFGKPMCHYSMIAAKKSKLIDYHYVATDCDKIYSTGKKIGFKKIERPKHLNGKKALGEDVFKYAVNYIKDKHKDVNLFVLLFANAPTIHTNLIDRCIRKIKANKKADSCVTVSEYNMFSPIRARKAKNGYLEPFVKQKNFFKSNKANCDRDSQGPVLFADGGVSVVKYRCFDNFANNLPPMRWMGKKILYELNNFGIDIDFSWQVGQVKEWLKTYGNKS
jgi:CMP-N-acetylneuraminic acid synthetase